jgi:hypothetical protein
VLIAVIENYQQADGSIVVPEVLRPYMGGIDRMKQRFGLCRQPSMNKAFTSEESLTDWKRLDAMQDEDIDLTDAPEITPEMFAKATLWQRASLDVKCTHPLAICLPWKVAGDEEDNH